MNENNKSPVKWGWNTLVEDIKSLNIADFEYQNEKELENAFISRLQSIGYEYIPLKSGADLQNNLKTQIEKLNQITFTDDEWESFLNTNILPREDNVSGVDRIERFQKQKVFDFTFKNGFTKNIKIVDIYEPHNNYLQVCNQLRTKSDDDSSCRIFDVVILLNGLPVVHIELKNSGISLETAFNQINNVYKRNYFNHSDIALMQYTQLFVISNGVSTKYFANNRYRKDDVYQDFAFTYFWSDFKNTKIEKLSELTETFFKKETLIAILNRYCTFRLAVSSDNSSIDKKSFLVMRPYQIAATEQIVKKVIDTTDIYLNAPLKRGGYIWHTTGSGKTLTSFKSSVILADNNLVDKVFFVVDRKDLDQQTIKEYNAFAPNTTDAIRSTTALTKAIENDNRKIIVTTIQKLNKFILRYDDHPIFNKHVALIFDECHRTQFGDMQRNIKSHFKNYHLFGFTGTPIFAEDAKSIQIQDQEHGISTSSKLATGDIFGNVLHTYTIIEAINDNNVLPFRTYFYNDFLIRDNSNDDGPSIKAKNIDKKAILEDKDRIYKIVENILNNYWTLTSRKKEAAVDKGLKCNAILATDSINVAKIYYQTFKEQLKQRDESKQLKIALIFTEPKDYSDTRDEADELEDRESIEDIKLNPENQTFLQLAVNDYNKTFKTNFNVENSDEFQAYYSDVAKNMKLAELDLLIVVNMFLTGFDAKCINTLFVDKTLVKHNLIQAFSRTNRIYKSSIKECGNIVCYAHNLKEEFDNALRIYSVNTSDSLQDVKDKVQIKDFQDYFGEYQKLLQELKENYPANNISAWQNQDNDINFTKLFGKFLSCKNMLSQCIEWDDDHISDPLCEDDYLKWIKHYKDFKQSWTNQIQAADAQNNPVYINEQLDFKLELVEQNFVSVDYIMNLLASFHTKKYNPESARNEFNKYLTLCPSIDNYPDIRELIMDFYLKYQNTSFDKAYWSLNKLDDDLNQKKLKDFHELVAQYKLKENQTAKKINSVIEGNSIWNKNDIDDYLVETDDFDIFACHDNTNKNEVYKALCHYCEKYRDEWFQFHTQPLPTKSADDLKARPIS